MTKFLLPLLVFAAAPALANTPAATVTPISFQRNGIAYVGTVETRGDVQLISGREVDSGRPFKLTVYKGYVSGTYAGSPVNYSVAQK